MNTNPTVADSTDPGPDRRASPPTARPIIADVPCRAGDIEPTRALHSVAILLRVLSGLLLLLMIVQVALGVTSTVAISFGVLFGEAIRLVIFAGLLWAAGDLAVLFVKSHYDVRASRILLARLVARIAPSPAPDTRSPRVGAPNAGRGDAAHTP